MDEVERMMTKNHGICRFSHLRGLGLTRYQIRDLVDAEFLRKTARGTYSLPNADPVLVKVAGLNLSVTCVSAATYHDLWVLRAPVQIHVVVDKGRHVPDYVMHRGHRNSRQLVAPVLDTVVHALRCLPGLEALVIAESAVIKGALDLAELLMMFSGERDWKIRQLINQLDLRSGSPMETVARVLMLNAGFAIEVQRFISGVGRVDFLVEGTLVVEIDGYDFHSSKTQFDNDRRRLNALSQMGIPLLRFSGKQVISAPEEFVQRIRDTLKTANTLKSRPTVPPNVK
ncbi:DUF559 domain-containing protein [Psychromicrobium sp. YIM B11713]|uniref:DUF559 domain-containing protein n=1 Tax=Psychromicrobium sp. YIM B11713 TaxID=3145233 RepID=UPI00374F39C7